MFEKLVVIEPVGLTESALDELRSFARRVEVHDDRPLGDDAIIGRIGDADAVLLTYTSALSRRVLQTCRNLKYVGMCNSLYSEESANVDIKTARELGIAVKGIRDYGDRGVVEYVVAELVYYLHGYGGLSYSDFPMEISGLRAGIVGLGATGSLVADSLRFFGAEVRYFSRTRKPDVESRGIAYLPLAELLEGSDVVCTCLNKNVVLLGEAEFRAFGNHKALFNTSIGPSFDAVAARRWLDAGGNALFCDSAEALGDEGGILSGHPRVSVRSVSSGITRQAYDRLSEKVLGNIRDYFGG